MQKTNTYKLSTWTLWAPLRFAVFTFCALTMTSLLYTFIATRIYTPAPIPQTPLLYLIILTFIGCATLFFIKLPRITPDRQSFIAAHNAQITLVSITFILISFLLLKNANEIIFKLIIMESSSTPSFIITVATFCIIFLYLIGILLSNFFLKIRRIQNFKIPTWKIILCIPFGFSALWTPGYILPTANTTNSSITIKSNWYRNLTNRITSHATTTIATYALITMLSGFIFGINATLLTFVFALIFGIWALQIGTKKFTKNITRQYTTFAIIINLILIAITACAYIYTPKITSINIHETTETINL